MGRQTPIERFIDAGTTDRRAAYDQRKRGEGRARVSLWIAGEDRDAFVLLAESSREGTEAERAVLRAAAKALADIRSRPVPNLPPYGNTGV